MSEGMPESYKKEVEEMIDAKLAVFAAQQSRLQRDLAAQIRILESCGQQAAEPDLPAVEGAESNEEEVNRLIDAARKTGRHSHRDATLILISYRHALRVSELTALRWNQIDLGQGLMHINRLKNGVKSTHPVRGPEIRDLRRLQRDYPDTPYVFVTERKGSLTASTVRKLIARAGEKAGLGFPVHPHMLRHGCGFKLANEGHDTRSIQHYMGHKNIQHTVRYTELAADRFNGFWKD